MATEKRQRQDARRTEKKTVEQAVKVKVEKARKRNRMLWIGVPAALVVGLAIWSPWSSSGTSDTLVAANDSGVTVSSTPTTTGVPSTISKALSTKPIVEIPVGDPPKTLQVKDLVVGTGAEAVKGSTVKVQYVGVSYSTKKQFDASWDRGAEPYDVVDLGNAPVIAGWNEGLLGAKQGSRRQLIIPPDKGYGDTEKTGIKAGETLVFVVDIIDVQPPAGASTTVAPTTVAGAATTTVARVAPTTTALAASPTS